MKTPPVLVSGTNLNSAGEYRAIKHLTVQVPTGTRFMKDVDECEEHMRRAAITMWPIWYGTGMNKSFCSVLKKTSNEIKFNIPPMGDRHAVTEGAWIVVDFVINGMWCSTDHCGIRCSIDHINLLSDAIGVADMMDDA
jgi:hypothetical protein